MMALRKVIDSCKRYPFFLLIMSVLITCSSYSISSEVYAEELIAFDIKFGGYGVTNGNFNTPHGIARSTSGSIFVVDTLNNQIQQFYPNGTFIAKWGGYFDEAAKFNSPTGIAVDKLGQLYIADTLYHRIQKFSENGTYMTRIGAYGSGDGKLKFPEGIAVDGEGNVYVADTGNNRIQKFSSEGKLIGKWGKYGVSNGNFNLPKGVALANDGTIYVADTGNNRIQSFSNDGTFIAKWGNHGSDDSKFNFPEGISVDTLGKVYVADTMNHRIQVFSGDGTFIAKWGEQGQGDGDFDMPRSILIGDAGAYVVDSNNNRIQRFDFQTFSLIDYPATAMNLFVNGTIIEFEVRSYSEISELQIDQENSRLSLVVGSNQEGNGTVYLPVGMLLKGPYSVTIDGEQAPVDRFQIINKSSTDQSGILIHYSPEKQHEITVTGTSVVPEFGNAILVLIALSGAVVLITRNQSIRILRR